jgi:acyl carrier protein
VSENLEAELLEYLGQRLPDYMVPAAVVRLEALPLTPNKKVDLRALPAPVTRVVASAADEPRDEIERVLAEFWGTVLGRERVGIHDHFFRLGGHSLQVMRVVAFVRKTFGVPVAASALFEEPTVAALAQRVREAS